MGAGRLRGSDLEAPFRGVRRIRTVQAVPPSEAPMPGQWHPRTGRPQAADAAERAGRAERERRERFLADCGALALLLRPGEVFCGVTAAELWNAPLAARYRDRVLHVAVCRPGRARRASGTAGHTIAQGADVRALRHGLPVSDAASTWLALAGLLPLNELVAVGDHLLHRPVFPDRSDPLRPHVTLEELESRTREFVGPGAAVARAAIKLVVTGAESRPESLLRLLLNDAKLPSPEVNPTIDDERGRIGRFDLVYREWKVIVEYDGDQHRTDDEQYELDMTRVERVTQAGWSVIRVRKRGLFREPRDTVRRVTVALQRAGWRRPARRPRPVPAARMSNRFDGTRTAGKERDGSS
ncbi:hypothetical protein B7R54_08475 [Subtercola boreus]|uniref:DUF559 domain-containing protein n=1 Tax=Subtercola boreus TaxID=120213 RepID=A0A3E0VK63_9MICO|nr:hypothetical protein B7R54_08475 [Subtercola boreus]